VSTQYSGEQAAMIILHARNLVDARSTSTVLSGLRLPISSSSIDRRSLVVPSCVHVTELQDGRRSRHNSFAWNIGPQIERRGAACRSCLVAAINLLYNRRPQGHC
jgi:hypothetical protein